MKYLKKIAKGWQTIAFFSIVFGSVIFISNAFGFNNYYFAETEVLILSANSSIDSGYDDLAQTMEIVLKTNDFYNLIQKKFVIDISAKDVQIKHYKKTNILKIRTKGNSISDTEKKIKAIYETLLSSTGEYYNKEDNVSIKTIKKPYLLSGYNLLWYRGLIGLVGGFIFGCFIVWLTDFRLQLFAKTKSVNNTIIRQKLKKELDKSSLQKELAPEIEEYVFGADGLSKKTIIEKNDFNKTEKEKAEKNIKTKKSNSKTKPGVKKNTITRQEIKFHRIVLNTILDGNEDIKKKINELELEKEENIVPDNLPIFIPKKKESVKINKTKKEKNNKKKDTSNHQKNNFTKKQEVKSVFDIEKEKPASAHNIANGFASPEPIEDLDDNNLTPEKIKKRLNRLLRGDL